MKHHHRLAAYLILGTLLGFFVLLYYWFRYDPTFQFQIIILAVFAYLLWGFFYHWIEKSLTKEVVLEYVGIGALTLSILFVLTMWR